MISKIVDWSMSYRFSAAATAAAAAAAAAVLNAVLNAPAACLHLAMQHFPLMLIDTLLLPSVSSARSAVCKQTDTSVTHTLPVTCRRRPMWPCGHAFKSRTTVNFTHWPFPVY
jgi:hypothetical protein